MTEKQQLAEIFAIADGEAYNVHQVFDLPGSMDIPRNHERRSGRIIPKRMDGFAVANGKTFATLSVRNYKDRVWTTSVSQLYGPDYSHRIAREPYAYGGNYTSPFPFHDLLMQIDGRTLRPDQTRTRRSRRVLGTGVVNASMAVQEIELNTINFCPVAPVVPALIRAIRVRNGGSAKRRIRVLSYFGFNKEIQSLPTVRITGTGFEASFGTAVLRVCSMGEGSAEMRGMEGGGLLWDEITRLSGTPSERRFTSNFDPMLKYSSYDPYEGSRLERTTRLPTGSTVELARDLCLRHDLSELGPDEERYVVLYMITGRETAETRACEDRLRKEGSLGLFRSTLSSWKQWSSRPKISTSSVQMDHLMDSIRVLIKTHQLHSGGFSTSMNFFGFRSWIRDNYYLGRTLLKMGKPEEAYKNLRFFYEKWKSDGICEHYPFQDTGRVDIWNLRTEGPSLLALMLRDYHAYTNDEAALSRLSEMATATVKKLSFSADGLQPLCGSETYRFATVTDPWAENADNTFASVCALEFAAELLSAKDPAADEIAEFRKQAKTSRKAITDFLVRAGRFVHYRSKDGTLDGKIVTNILTRPLILGFSDASDPVVRKGVLDAWDNNYRDGLLRCDPNFYLIPGNTIGFMLYCLAELEGAPAGVCLESLLRLASCTGTFFEFYDIYDTRISNERLRLWDSASILEGMYHYLFGLKPVRDHARGLGIEVAPHLLDSMHELSIDGFPIQGDSYDLRVSRSEMLLSKNGKEILKANKPLRVELYRFGAIVKPVGSFLPEISGEPLCFKLEKGGPVATGGEYLGTLDLAVRLDGTTARYRQDVVEGSLVRRMESGGRSWSLSRSSSDDSSLQIELVLVNRSFQKVEFLEPGAHYHVCGRASTSSGAPYEGPVSCTVGGNGSIAAQSDGFGCFRIPVQTTKSRDRADFRCTVEAGKTNASLSRAIRTDPYVFLDDAINDLEGRAALLCSGDADPLHRRILYEIWKQVMLANGKNLPLLRTPSFEGALIATDCAERAPQVCTVGALVLRKDNLSIYERHHPRGYCYVLKVDPVETVAGNAATFVDLLKNRSDHLYRRYRDWKEHSFIPLYEYNATMRDVRVVQELGTAPEPAMVQVTLASPVPCYIADGERTVGELRFGEPACSPSGFTPETPEYVRVFEGQGDFVRTLTGFQCTEFIRKLVIEAEARESAPIEVGVKISLPQTTFFLENPFPLHFDGGRDQMMFYRGRQGEHILEVVLHPGTLLQETKSKHHRTMRQIEVAVGGLKPDWM